MNNLKIIFEQDFLKSTRKIVTNATLSTGTVLNLSVDKCNRIKASFDKHRPGMTSNNKPKRGETTRHAI